LAGIIDSACAHQKRMHTSDLPSIFAFLYLLIQYFKLKEAEPLSHFGTHYFMMERMTVDLIINANKPFINHHTFFLVLLLLS
jgi:hypothetical protein